MLSNKGCFFNSAFFLWGFIAAFFVLGLFFVVRNSFKETRFAKCERHILDFVDGGVIKGRAEPDGSSYLVCRNDGSALYIETFFAEGKCFIKSSEEFPAHGIAKWCKPQGVRSWKYRKK